MEFDRLLDARGLKCPLPILRCKKSISEVQFEEILKVMATDPGSVRDFQAFCKQTQHELLLTEVSDDTFTFYIRKKNVVK